MTSFLQAQLRVASLEADKMNIEHELDNLMKRFTTANNDLKEMTSKYHNLEDELMKERMNSSHHQNYNKDTDQDKVSLLFKISRIIRFLKVFSYKIY